ncbi:sporulation integral membrane protein YtvI [Thermosyntropha lipolytica DSM 11003]|uniref:Sporulation integral membrane protein YtvI n=1 Tax=Thermosyntropha lipolytica DSM 11003 TaxID=1123382 RepID=A0A1M5KWM3_9FIRM|nr:sporulation integral membrane protein YtvI [Thermosyntropha lipolytica]SHG57147.1 sporulation integral membrane protein YtvI [Thermosyntropha lipolytica DSM 11003]
MEPELLRYLKILTKLAILVMGLIAFYLLFIYVFPILGKLLSYIPALFMPFIIAIILAVVIEPLVNIFEKRFCFKRSIAVIVSLLLVVGGSICIISLLIAKIVREISGMLPELAGYSDHITSNVVNALSDIKLWYLRLNIPPELQNSIQQNLQNSLKGLEDLMGQSANFLIKILALLPELFIFLIIAMVATYFIIKDRALIRVFFFKFIPVQAQSPTRNVAAQLFSALTGFFKAYSILVSITALVTMIGLKILGVKYIITIGIIVGLLDILPVLGPGIFFIPWAIWLFITGNSRLAVGILILYTLISAVRQFLEPKIVGDNLGLHPLATLFSLYVGLKLGGVTGMVLGPVLMVVIIAAYKAGVFDNIKWRPTS